MKIFITSINKKLFDSYGSRFVESWKRYAALDTKIIICTEGDINNEMIQLSSDNIKFINIESNRQKKFVNKFGKFNEARGIKFIRSVENPQYLSYKYNYRYDAVRFSFKIFSFIKCFETGLIDDDFAWLDADVVCLKPFSSADLDFAFPSQNQIASFLGRNSFPRPNAYSECGFVGYNYKNKNSIKFIEDMCEIYMSGDIFLLKEWHDCMVFDHVREIYQSKSHTFLNLSKDFEGEDHPFMKTDLGKYFDHLKGPMRKKQGHS